MRNTAVASAFLALVPLLCAPACGPPRVDGSSEAAFRSSLADVAAGLDSAQLQRFDDAIVLLTSHELCRAQVRADPHRGLRQFLDGLTYEQIVALPGHVRREHAGAACGGAACPLVRR